MKKNPSSRQKKNVPMRMASVLLVATMLTACLTAGTFAKYTTSDEATDSARVAKFGVVVSASGSLYGEEYASGTESDSNVIIAYSGSTNTGTVQADTDTDDNDVVAPGTKSDTGLGFDVSGTPEVDVLLTGSASSENIYLTSGEYGVMVDVTAYVTKANYTAATYYTYDSTYEVYKLETSDAEFDNTGTTTYYELEDYVNLTSTYYPVVYTLNNTNSSLSYKDTDTDYTNDTLNDIVELLTKDTDADSDGTDEIAVLNGTTYQANTDLSGTSGFGSATLTWEWAYERYKYVEATTSNSYLDDTSGSNSFVSGVTYYTKTTTDGVDTYSTTTDASYQDTTTYYVKVVDEMYDGADTILGDLSAIANGTMGGVVVKLDDDGNYKAPTPRSVDADTGDVTVGDYNLTTSFDLSITVTQVD